MHCFVFFLNTLYIFGFRCTNQGNCACAFSLSKNKCIGTSDPYVKFKLNGRLLYKSKTVHKDLNPVWDETFIVPIEDPFQSIQIKVFDYDWGLQDDFMGSALLDLTTLELSRVSELMIPLEDSVRPSGTAVLSKSKLNDIHFSHIVHSVFLDIVSIFF